MKPIIKSILLATIYVLTIICCLTLYDIVRNTPKETTNENIETEEVVPLTETTTTMNTTTKKVTKKVIKTTKMSVATATKSEYQNYAKQFSNYDDTQMSCLTLLWEYESGWNPNDYNKLSGACGIPQSKPCNKIKKQQGSNDWQSQIRWGINYINYKYGSPCAALEYHKQKGWY
jgi:Fe2+ transport system protein B